MNERIRKLAERAGFSYMPSDYPDMADLYKCADFEIEKFAELIIRECGVALSPMLRDMVSRGQAFDLIKEHFGVEE